MFAKINKIRKALSADATSTVLIDCEAGRNVAGGGTFVRLNAEFPHDAANMTPAYFKSLTEDVFPDILFGKNARMKFRKFEITDRDFYSSDKTVKAEYYIEK